LVQGSRTPCSRPNATSWRRKKSTGPRRRVFQPVLFPAGNGAGTILGVTITIENVTERERLRKQLAEASPEEKGKIYIRLKLLQGMQQAGIRVALDDIGVRSPYLYHLLCLEPEFLKMDPRDIEAPPFKGLLMDWIEEVKS
jgi:hypothetical protein